MHDDERILIERTPRYGTSNAPVVPSVLVSDSTVTVPSPCVTAFASDFNTLAYVLGQVLARDERVPPRQWFSYTSVRR